MILNLGLYLCLQFRNEIGSDAVVMTQNPALTPIRPDTAYKIMTAKQWSQFQADGVFYGAPVDLADGYIHLSTAGQLTETLNKHFSGQAGLIIVQVNLAELGGSVKWEISRGGELFPHVYAALPIQAVLSTQ